MRRCRRLGAVVIVCAFAAGFSAPAAAKIIYVDDDAKENGNGLSWAGAYKYLQDALKVTAPGDEVRVAQGIYCPDQGVTVYKGRYYPPRGGPSTGPEDLSFVLRTGVAIRGGFAGLGATDPNERDVRRCETILSGDREANDEDKTSLWSRLLPGFVLSENSKNVVRDGGDGVWGGSDVDRTAVLDGFTITGATENAVYLYEGGPTITNCTFRPISAVNLGRGMYTYHGQPSLLHCTFRGNSSSGAGGAICADGGTLTLVDCNFVANAALGSGGAIDSSECHLAMTDCAFQENASPIGGAVVQWYETLEMTGCRFEGNLADNGGALHVVCGSVVARKCVFEGNWAQFTAGTLYMKGGYWASTASLTFERCTFTGNSAQQAGVLYTTGMYFPKRECLTFTNCLFAGNRAETLGGVLYGDYARMTITNCTFADNQAGTWATLGWVGNQWVPSDTPALTVTNCIVWDGARSLFQTFTGADGKSADAAGNAILITYSDIRGGWLGEGNIDIDPRFARPGSWLDAPDPNVSVARDHPDATWLEGDYHLMSQAGRWDPVEADWVQDDATSPCVDAGDPKSSIGEESEPNGGRIDMGAYGGTAEASRSSKDVD